jgi:hypothetical protein
MLVAGGRPMTEAEWLACDEPEALLRGALGTLRTRNRVLRLFVANFWMWQADRLDASPDREGMRTRAGQMEAWAETGRLPRGLRAKDYPPDGIFFNKIAARSAEGTAAAASWRVPGPDVSARLVGLLRDIFGNPFRPATFSPSWRTDTAVTIARQMYAARDFSAMPILADALQDAGCDSDDVLDHCRGEGPHVRGCWVCDLVLGRE